MGLHTGAARGGAGGGLGGDELLQLQTGERGEALLQDPGGRGPGTSVLGSLCPIAPLPSAPAMRRNAMERVFRSKRAPLPLLPSPCTLMARGDSRRLFDLPYGTGVSCAARPADSGASGGTRKQNIR